MPLEFVKSQRGKDLLVHGGFIYKKDREGKEKMIWRCNEIKNCPGRAHTMQGTYILFLYGFFYKNLHIVNY